MSLDSNKYVVAVGYDTTKRAGLVVGSSIRALNEGFAFVDVVVKSFYVVNGMLSQYVLFP